MTWVYLIKSEGEVNSLFPKFYKMVESQSKTKIQVFHSNNGREYHSLEVQ